MQILEAQSIQPNIVSNMATATKSSNLNPTTISPPPGDPGPSSHRQYGTHSPPGRGSIGITGEVGYDQSRQYPSSSRQPLQWDSRSSQQQPQQQQQQQQQNSSTSSNPSSLSNSTTAIESPSQTSMPTTAASLMREGPRDFTVIRDVGDGSFGTVCLADWKSPLPSGTMLSPMQHPTTRPEYVGKRLVAIKKMKKPFPNWAECMKLKELKSLLAIPHHPNIIPLYDAFLMPGSKELHFVFECMEGNLYQLTKSRKGRPLAGGLVASIFQQIVRGLHHIHQHGYFHRDMKPENLLITTTGLADYPSASPLAVPGTPPEKDVLVIVKLADFGLARETLSKPPYTEYVSTRWYRAPEVLLRSRDYSNPVDLWALGTILAEIVNLKPLFPGQSEVDQVLQICDILGDPAHEYGKDDRGRRKGGGEWQRGIKMARAVGFEFPSAQPITFSTLFSSKVPPSLVDCIQDLLRYDPRSRLTTDDLLNHYYYTTLAPRLQPPQARAVVAATTPEQQASMMRQMPRAHMQSLASISSLANVDAANIRRAIPPSHSAISQMHKIPFGAGPQPIAANHQHQLLQARSPVASNILKARQQADGDIAMEGASPQIHTTISERINDDQRISSVSQYPAFPESVSNHSRLSTNQQINNSNGGDVSMMSPQHHHLQQQHHLGGRGDGSGSGSSGTHIESQRSTSYSQERRNEAGGRNSYESYAQAQANQQNVVTHGLVSPHPGSTNSSGEIGSRETAEASNETLSSVKDTKKRGGKGWGINISSVLGSGTGSGKNANNNNNNPTYPINHQSPISGGQGQGIPASSSNTSITPAQQIIADHVSSQPPVKPADSRKAKKEAEKAAREAEKAKRAAQEHAARERARAVMQKRNQILASSNARDQVEWLQLADNDMTKAFQAQQNVAQQQAQQQAAVAQQAQQQAQQMYLNALGNNSVSSPNSSRSLLQQQQFKQQQHDQQHLASGGHPQIIGQTPSLMGQLSQYPGQMHSNIHGYEPMSEKAWGKQPRHTHTSNSDHSNMSSRFGGGTGSYSPSPGMTGGLMNNNRSRVRQRDDGEDEILTENDPRRQSMQSYHTRDSDPGPMRNAINAYPHTNNYRPETTSSLNSAPSITRYGAGNGGDRSSVDTRSVASSLDNQLILNMENMTAAETNQRYRQGSMSPGPVHLIGNRPSFSRQSHGSRSGSAHRGGSASPLHHTAPPRFHPYSSGVVGSASLSNPNMPLPNSTTSQNQYPLPSLASIANSSGSDAMENLQSDVVSTIIGPRPRSKRRMSQGGHRAISRGSATSRDGSLRHHPPSSSTKSFSPSTVNGNGGGGVGGVNGSSSYGASPINPMFNVNKSVGHSNYPSFHQQHSSMTAMMLDNAGNPINTPGTNYHQNRIHQQNSSSTTLPSFSELAAGTNDGTEGYYSNDTNSIGGGGGGGTPY